MTTIDLAMVAVRNPYTTTPGAFTAARERGLVEIFEGCPTRTAEGRNAMRTHLAAQGVDDEHGKDPAF